jgi:hypothetical protein
VPIFAAERISLLAVPFLAKKIQDSTRVPLQKRTPPSNIQHPTNDVSKRLVGAMIDLSFALLLTLQHTQLTS